MRLLLSSQEGLAEQPANDLSDGFRRLANRPGINIQDPLEMVRVFVETFMHSDFHQFIQHQQSTVYLLQGLLAYAIERPAEDGFAFMHPTLCDEIMKTCSCGERKSVTQDHMEAVIDIEVPPPGTTLCQVLHNYFNRSEEIHDHGNRCSTCQEPLTMKKVPRIRELSPILVFALKRIVSRKNRRTNTWGPVLIDTKVPIGTGSITVPIRGRTSRQFELVAAVKHIGRVNSGHYIALLKKDKDSLPLMMPTSMMLMAKG